MKKKLAFLGAGSHADALLMHVDKSRYEIIGFFDDKNLESFRQYPVLGKTADCLSFLRNGKVDVLFVSIGDNAKRKAVYEYVCGHYGDVFINILSKDAFIGEGVCLSGSNIFIGARVFLGAYCVIEKNCVVNTAAVVEHHSYIHAHCNIAPAATLNGAVILNEGVYAGSGSVFIQLVEVAKGSMIGAGAVVVKSLSETGTYVGVPARLLKKEVSEQ